MFVAALLDAWPDLQGGLREALRAVQLPESVAVAVVAHKDHALSGTRFRVEDRAETRRAHTSFREIRERLSGSALASGVAERALDVFALLAEAEASVHDRPIDEVTFHEVGAWDSIADIVGAAFLIDAVGPARWSIASLPLGSGRVKSAHGALPVPAPATALLLEGFAVHDDGLEGERVTPTGAAILRHLQPTYRLPGEPARIVRVGMGFGAREFPGISNMLRILVLEELAPGLGEDRIAVVRFEVDDQSPEDLAVGLDRIRELDGVVDALQAPAFGKKGRMLSQVQVLAQADALEPVIRACFAETTTLGVRWRTERRAVLERTTETYVGREGSVRVKSATRPSGGVTGKAELDDVAEAPGGRAARDRLRREAEQGILGDPEGDPDE